MFMILIGGCVLKRVTLEVTWPTKSVDTCKPPGGRKVWRRVQGLVWARLGTPRLLEEIHYEVDDSIPLLAGSRPLQVVLISCTNRTKETGP